MHVARRSEPVYRITGAQTSLSDEQRGRTRRYLWSMGLRTACFLGAIVAHGWLRWVLVLAALVLPWMAVVTANVGRERGDGDPPTAVQVPDLPALESGRTGPDRSGPDGPPNSISGS